MLPARRRRGADEQRGDPHHQASTTSSAPRNPRPPSGTPTTRPVSARCGGVRHAAARPHPIINLEHVERAGEHQEVDHARKHRDAPERPTALLERGGQTGVRRARGCKRSDHVGLGFAGTRIRLLSNTHSILGIINIHIKVSSQVTGLRAGGGVPLAVRHRIHAQIHARVVWKE
jgi:hypothetical protein